MPSGVYNNITASPTHSMTNDAWSWRERVWSGSVIRSPPLGWGLLSQFSPFRYFPHFPLLSKQTLAIEYRVHIWQVSPQLSCGDTCQIWMWFGESNRYFCKIENFAYGEISERSFSNPQPWSVSRMGWGARSRLVPLGTACQNESWRTQQM